jgi:segregation and condensation protein B
MLLWHTEPLCRRLKLPMDESAVEHNEETIDSAKVASDPGDTDEAVVEAVLFASDTPLPPTKIASATELPPRRIKQAVAQLNERYSRGGHAFRIEDIAGGYQMMTLPEYHDVLRRLLHVKKDSRLTQAAMETLAIVAYRQPILRADVESIRGVASGEVLRGLLERQLVKIVGRAEVIGRPMLYGTSKRFLEVFGLASLDDLPRVEELRSGADAPMPAASAETPLEDEQGSSDSPIEAKTMKNEFSDEEYLPESEDLHEEDEAPDDDFDDEDLDVDDFDDMDDDEDEEYDDEDDEDDEDEDDEE